MITHTPGPWHVYISPGGWQTCVCAEDGSIITRMGNYSGSPVLANAHLIAAAPDLLAALRSLCSEFYMMMNPSLLPSAYRAACAAIAKAEGETP